MESIRFYFNVEVSASIASIFDVLKTIATRSIEAFQTTDEYNTVLFSWYFKGFELLRRYLVKHPFGVDLGKLDLEEVEQEMAADEAAQSSATETNTPESATANGAPESAPADNTRANDDVVADAWTWSLEGKKNFLYVCLLCFGSVNLIS